jgi:hypothetical protein
MAQTFEQKEQALKQHTDRADRYGFHVDGCYYCGGQHPSDRCQSSDRDEYWESE